MDPVQSRLISPPPGRQVQVQSGVMLGMKIALGFVLFVALAGIGSCVACATLTSGVAAVSGVSEEAKAEVARLDLSGFHQALDLHSLKFGRYPTTDEGLGELYRVGILKGSLKKDPWGDPYVYRFPGERDPNGYDLYSRGLE